MNLLELPPDKPLPVSNNLYYNSQNTEPMPYVFLADEAFPLSKNYLKPYYQSGLIPKNILLVIVCKGCKELLKMLLEF